MENILSSRKGPQLEIALRKEIQQKEFYDCARALAEGKYIKHNICGFIQENRLTNGNLANIIAYSNISKEPEAQASFCGFKMDLAVG